MRDGTGPFADRLAGREIAWSAPGVSTIAYLEDLGVLECAPLLVHAVHATEADVEAIVQWFEQGGALKIGVEERTEVCWRGFQLIPGLFDLVHVWELASPSDPDETVAAAVTIALGHIEYATTTDQVLRHMIPTHPGSLGRGHMYALGMTGSPGLSAIAASSSAPDWQRRAARWWLRTGPAIRRPQ